MPEPSPLQQLPFRLHILYSSKESVHCLISKCIGEVIYDSHYYNRLAAPKHVKTATIISPTFPSLAPHRRKSLIKSVGVTLALVCFYNLQRKFDIFRKWWCLQTSYSLQKFLSLDKISGKVLCPEASFFCLFHCFCEMHLYAIMIRKGSPISETKEAISLEAFQDQIWKPTQNSMQQSRTSMHSRERRNGKMFMNRPMAVCAW